MDPTEPSDDDQQRLAKMFADLESRTRKVGLYLEQATVTYLPGQEEEEDPDEVMVLAQFAIGERAFTKAVQDPEQHGFDEQFRDLTTDEEEQEFRRIQRERLDWLSKRREEDEDE